MVSSNPNESWQSLDAALVVVMPVYNEEANIAQVICEWLELLRNMGVSFQIVALDDGSYDQTRDILLRLQAEQPDVLRVVSKANSGHGLTCRAGYEIAVRSRADWVLQIDSDGQCDPRHFPDFWRRREEYDCIFGVRASRDDGVLRVITSRLCRWASSLICGRDLKDPNVPYRLMRRAALQEALPHIPVGFHIHNVALTCVLRKLPGLRWNYFNIHFRERQGGKASAGLLKIMRSGAGMLFGLMRIRVRTPRPGLSKAETDTAGAQGEKNFVRLIYRNDKHAAIAHVKSDANGTPRRSASIEDQVMPDSLPRPIFRHSIVRTTARHLGTFAIIMVLISAALGPRHRIGDGFEYWGMLINLAEFGRPYSTTASNASLLDFESKHQDIFGKPFDVKQNFRRLTLPNGETDFNHFWFYSLLAVPFFWGVQGLGVHPSLAFTFLHLTLFYIALSIARRHFGRTGGLTLVVLTFFSPVGNYLNVAHTEFFTVQVSFIAVVYLLRRKWLHSALALAVLALQNPAFGPIAVVLSGFEIATVLARRRWDIWKFNYALRWLLLPVLLAMHPAYYYSRWSTLTPQLVAGGITPEATSIKRMILWIIDPDVGLLPNWPLGLCLISVGVLIYFNPFGNSLARIRHRLISTRWPVVAGLLIYALIIAYAQSKTVNLNSASIGSAARYGLWYIPLLFPVLLSLLRLPWDRRLIYRVAKSLVAIGMVCSAILVWTQDFKRTYREPSLVASFFYRHFPTLYNPPQGIYAARYSGLGESRPAHESWAVSNKEGTKILVQPRMLPTLKPDAIPRVVGYRGRLNGSLLMLNQASYRPHRVSKSDLFLHPSAAQVAALKWAPSLAMGNSISGDAIYDDFFVGDWSTPGKERRWTTGADAIVTFQVVGNGSEFLLELDGNAFIPRPGFSQIFAFHLNNHLLGLCEVRDRAAHRFTFKIRSEMLHHINELVIKAKTPISPKATGYSADPRLLGWYFHRLTIHPSTLSLDRGSTGQVSEKQ